jgi:hypothetical protein
MCLSFSLSHARAHTHNVQKFKFNLWFGLLCLTSEILAGMIHLAYVSVKMKSGNLLRGCGAQLCHLMRIDILM